MPPPSDQREPPGSACRVPTGGNATLLEKHRWLTFVLPLAVFALVGLLEPTPRQPGGAAIGLAIPYPCYPWVYMLKIALTVAAIGFVLPGYGGFPWRVSPLAVVVGVLGIFVWVGLCKLGLEAGLLAPLGLGGFIESGARSAFNPFEQLPGHPGWAWGFLSIRFVGLVVVVPLVEEFFLRGFLMRVVMAERWWEVPFGAITRTAVLVGVLYPVLSHPGEVFAAVAWFSLVTWLMVRTRNIWDCVVAHAVTNLLLGVYVVGSQLLLGGNNWYLM